MYKPTDAMVENQQRGRALKKRKQESLVDIKQFNVLQKSMTASTDGFSLEEVSELYHAATEYKVKIDKYNIDYDALPTHQYLAFLEAGGNATIAWASNILQKNNIIKAYHSTAEDLLTREADSTEVDNWSKMSVSKSVNQDLMQATFVALVPEEFDLHGDIYSHDEVRKACHNYNEYCRVANLYHLIPTDKASAVESYISPVDMVLGETVIKSGTWLQVWQFHDEGLWAAVKCGDITGISIGAVARKRKITNEEL